MLRSLTVEQLGKRIEAVDRLILRLVNHRMGLAISVGARKRADKDQIYRRDAENKRLDALRVDGRKLGLNEGFVEALFYVIIGESCKQQMIRLQRPPLPMPNTKNDEVWFKICKNNLRLLTEKVAGSYDQAYDTGYSASSAYRAYEDSLIDEQVRKLESRRLVVDLGCATGAQALRLAPMFKSAVGFDLSLHMIERAKNKAEAAALKDVRFEVAELDDGIPLDKESASLVIANFGTASDIRDAKKLIGEVQRVLHPGGRFLLSFYNKDALVYCWDFLPWPIGLAAEINEELKCLDVHVGDETFLVHAERYSPADVADMFSGGLLQGPVIRTFPTMSPLLPSQLLLEGTESAKDLVTGLDRALEMSGRGAYIVVTGSKK